MNEEATLAMEMAREALGESTWSLQGGHCRGAVRAAYYAMFHAAEALLLAGGREFSSHQAVIAAVGRDFAATGQLPKHLHMYLARGFRARQEADYSRSKQFATEDCELWIDRAEEFLAAIEAYLAAHPDEAAAE